MPLIRTESSQKLANQEGRILLALDDMENGCIKSFRAVAELYSILRSILHARAHRRSSHVDKRLLGYKLTQLEEDSLTE